MTYLKPRTATVVIYQGDDMPRLTELRRAAETARVFEQAAADALDEARESASESARAGDDLTAELDALAEAEAETKARQDEFDTFVDEAAERALSIVLQTIGRGRFRTLMAEHPPRKVMVKVEPVDEDSPPTEVEQDHPDDVGYDVNTETFPEALLTYIDVDEPEVRTIKEPEFTSSKAVKAFLDNELEEGDFPGLWTAAYYQNRMPSADPKALRYSPAHLSSSKT